MRTKKRRNFTMVISIVLILVFTTYTLDQYTHTPRNYITRTMTLENFTQYVDNSSAKGTQPNVFTVGNGVDNATYALSVQIPGTFAGTERIIGVYISKINGSNGIPFSTLTINFAKYSNININGTKGIAEVAPLWSGSNSPPSVTELKNHKLSEWFFNLYYSQMNIPNSTTRTWNFTFSYSFSIIPVFIAGPYHYNLGRITVSAKFLVIIGNGTTTYQKLPFKS